MIYTAQLKLPDGSYQEHILIRTEQIRNNKMINPEKYEMQQDSSSIDTLSQSLMQLNAEVQGLETQLDETKEKQRITQNILKDKLRCKLTEMGEILPEAVSIDLEEVFDGVDIDEDESPLELKEHEYEGEDADL